MPMRTLTRILPSTLLPLVVAAGCSTLRPEVSPELKTFAAVGDRPEPVVSGPPGEAVVVERARPDRQVSPEGTIAGRVVDARGGPVAGARVRLAADGTAKGRLARTYTDDAGGFTLRGLRPSTTYTVIAEWEDDEGVIASRVNARAPDDDLRIRLVENAQEPEIRDRPSTLKAGRADRVRPAEVDREPPLRVNPDDVDPPPPLEAERFVRNSGDDLRANLQAGSPVWKASGAPASPRRDSDLEPVLPSETPTRKHERPETVRPTIGTPIEDDVPNPLPPAIERPSRARPGPVPAYDDPEPLPVPATSKPRSGATSRPKLPAADEPRPMVTAGPESAPVVAELPADEAPIVDLPPITAPSSPPADTPKPIAPAPTESRPVETPATLPEPVEIRNLPPVEMPSAELPATAPTPAEPVVPPQEPEPTLSNLRVLDLPEMPRRGESAESESEPIVDASSDSPEPIVDVTPASPEPATPQPDPPTDFPGVPDNLPDLASVTQEVPQDAPAVPLDLPQGMPGDTVPASAEVRPEVEERSFSMTTTPSRRKVTWGDLESKVKGSEPAAAKADSAITPTPSLLERARNGFRRTSTTAPTAISLAPIVEECEFDVPNKRLVDFHLTDLSGHDVRFKDFDSDLILLDFWGTWCAPCLDGIPHLVQLQRAFGPKRLKVVGIAYEQVNKTNVRATVSESAESLGINYPVLLGAIDGPSPLRDALHVQFYPTMILLDRDGRVLQRLEGSTAQNLTRIERAIRVALEPNRGDSVRR